MLWVSFLQSYMPSGFRAPTQAFSNRKFLRTSILKNVCEPLLLLFFKLILQSTWQRTHYIDKVTELIKKYENTFICTLHAAVKRNNWNMSLWIFMFSWANLYYRYAQRSSYWVLNLKPVKIADMKSTPIWISKQINV